VAARGGDGGGDFDGCGWGMGWLVAQGISQGETKMPSKQASRRRVLKREEEPVSFWAALGVHGLVGLWGAGFGRGGLCGRLGG
jgi:hypothetical protein